MAKKTAYYGCLLALAVICGYVEFLLPINLGIPGIKLGLANIIAVWLLYDKGILPALAVNTGRIILVGILFGNVMSIAYALCGGTLSVVTMAIVKRANCFSAAGVSIAGGFAHNIGQLAVAGFVIGTRAVIYYLPFLSVSGVVTGLAIGVAAGTFYKRIRRT